MGNAKKSKLELLKEPDVGGKADAGSSNPEIKPETRGTRKKGEETDKEREQREGGSITKALIRPHKT